MTNDNRTIPQQQNPNEPMCVIPQLPAPIAAAQDKFEVALRTAQAIDIVNNVGAAFSAAQIIMLMRDALTDEVMVAIFMPLMNSKVGFRTDRDGRPNKRGEVQPLYTINVVRDAIIDAALIGLRPTGNQFNIISGTMYPTKEGYTSLLKKLGAKYVIDIQQNQSKDPGFAEFPCKISYCYNGEKNSLTINATVRRDQYASYDQLRGKAERRAKKALYEYLTGTDYGDADEMSSRTIDTSFVDMSHAAAANQGTPIEIKPAEPAATQPQSQPQPQSAATIATEQAHPAMETAAAPAQQPTPQTLNPGF